jgi:holo-[acyl-carrier protein] synthase
MIYGIGIDVVDVERFGSALKRWGPRLTGRLFTRAELDYCMGHRHPERHLAARFAAKVSLCKALGRSLPYAQIEVARNAEGRPSLIAPGAGAGLRFSLTMSHEGAMSIAHTIVEKV